jgi:uncharacterized protein DUF3485
MARYLPVGVGLLLVVVCALVQGNMSERWGKFPELQLYADQLSNVPTEIGDWHSEAREEPNKRTLEAAGAIGSLSRDYTNDKGETVSLFIVTGRLGDLFYHNPDRCYRASGFEPQEDKQRFEIPVGDGETADFFAARFVKTDETSKKDQMIYWSWCASGKWVATDEQKWVFRGHHALYKLYLIYTPTKTDNADHNPAKDFIPVLIPALNQAFEKATSEGQKLTTQT